MFGPHKSSVTRAKEKLGVDERAEQRITGSAIESPQPLRLRRRQAESWHLDVLPLNTPKNVVMRLIRS